MKNERAQTFVPARAGETHKHHVGHLFRLFINSCLDFLIKELFHAYALPISLRHTGAGEEVTQLVSLCGYASRQYEPTPGPDQAGSGPRRCSTPSCTAPGFILTLISATHIDLLSLEMTPLWSVSTYHRRLLTGFGASGHAAVRAFGFAEPHQCLI